MVSAEAIPRYFLYRQPPWSVRNRGGWFKKPTQGDGAKAQGPAPCYWRVYCRHAVVGLTSGSAVAIPAAPVASPPGRFSGPQRPAEASCRCRCRCPFRRCGLPVAFLLLLRHVGVGNPETV